MTTFSLIALGILIGTLFAVVLAAVGVMAYVSWRQREESATSRRGGAALLNRNNQVIDDLRHDVTAALASMDANRLHDASVAIQQGAKKLDHAVTTLNKVIFAAGMGDAGMGITGEILDEMQDVARPRQVIEYGDMGGGQALRGPGIGGSINYPPPGTFPNATDDPFVKWRAAQQDKGAQQSGASFPTSPAGPLPDLDAAYEEDLADPAIMSDHNIGTIPGMTTQLEE